MRATLGRVKRLINRAVVAPLRNPYMPVAYRYWGEKPDWILESILDPYLKRRDRDTFKHYLRPMDVFVVGHPKSGNTWMAYMLAIIGQTDRTHHVTLANVGTYVPVVHGKDSWISKYEHLRNPRIFRNEYPVHPELYPRIIYLVRDPRAVLVSYYEMYCVVRPEALMTLNAFVEEYLEHGCVRKFEPLVRWDRQVLEWYTRAEHDDRILLVKYEDTVRDRRSVLERVACFCGIPYGESDLAIAVAQSSFEAMKKDEETHGAESYMKVKEKRGMFVRRGKTDGWKEEMDPTLIAEIESEFASVMKLVGYMC